MQLFIIIVLAIVQGIAEFLPVSSSGHLVLLQQLPYFQEQLQLIGDNIEIFISVMLHIATLLAIIIYLRKDIIQILSGIILALREKDIKRSEVLTALYIIAASIPAAVLGFLFHDYLSSLFSSALSASFMLIANGFMLLSTKIIPVKNRQIEETGFPRAVGIGFFQAIAMIPGISRSGATIAGGMLLGMEPVVSAKFSFLMAIPVISGAGFLEFLKMNEMGISSQIMAPLGISMIISLIVALFSMKILFALVKRVRLNVFGYYTIAVGVIGIIWYMLVS